MYLHNACHSKIFLLLQSNEFKYNKPQFLEKAKEWTQKYATSNKVTAASVKVRLVLKCFNTVEPCEILSIMFTGMCFVPVARIMVELEIIGMTPSLLCSLSTLDIFYLAKNFSNSAMALFSQRQGWKKKLNSTLPLRQAALKSCLPWASLNY